MATVTGYTADRMQEIEDDTIIGGTVVDDELILVRRGGGVVNAGNVRGAKGDQGDQGDTGPPFNFAGYREPLHDFGDTSGVINLDFGTNNAWRVNPTGAITVTTSNLPSSTHIGPGTLIIANANFSVVWPAGTDFPDGIPPVLLGETILGIVARSTGIVVGISWRGVA